MHLLVTTDGSARSLTALTQAAALRRAIGADLTLLRVLDPVIDGSERFAATRAEAVEATAAAWQHELVEVLRRAGVPGEALVAVKNGGEPIRDAILRVADERASDLIVMDSRGTGALRHAVLGSVTLGVVAATERGVMVTGANVGPAWPGDRYPILATTDGSPASSAIVPAVSPLLAAPAVEITLLRFCWPESDQSRATHQADLNALAARLGFGERVQAVLREDAMVDGVGSSILAAARDLPAAAVALATHGESAAYHLFAGSTALSVVAHSLVPVILARAAAPQPAAGD